MSRASKLAKTPILADLDPSARALSSRFLRFSAWASFVLNVVIVATGGAVRLTGSGLGCSEWPLCTPDSLVPTRELGIHGVIEFGNRTITGVLVVFALAVLLSLLYAVGGRRSLAASLWFALGGIVAGFAAWLIAVLVDLPDFKFILFCSALLLVVIAAAVHSLRITPERRDLTALAWVVLIGVVAQALVGGITVLTRLNPFIVGFHYVSSVVLACVTAAFLVRLREPGVPRERAVPLPFLILAHVTTLAMAVTIVFGVLTTGYGPHSGDANIAREGFDASLMAHIHAWPGYILLALTLVLVVWASIARLRPRNWLWTLLVAELVQIAVGVFQARMGLPAPAVGVHMVLAALTAATMTVVVLRLKRPVA